MRNLSLFLLLLASGPAFSAGEVWPEESWQRGLPSAVGVSEGALEPLLDYVFPESFKENDRRGIRTDALLLVRGGLLFYEKYREPFTATTKHTTWSATKTVLGVLAGVAEREKHLHRLDPVRRFVTESQIPADLRIDHLLSFTSGYKWNEGYEFAPLWSDVIAMLYTDGLGDMARYVFGRPRSRPPGERWRYSSGDSNLLARVIQNSLPKSSQADFPERALFRKLGMRNSLFERDASDTWVGSSYLFSSAEDLARIGLLLLRQGRWKSDQILPEDWVEFMRGPATAYLTTNAIRVRSPRFAFSGKHLWVNSVVDGAGGVHVAWKDAPPDTFCASGHWGQYIFVIPSLDLVAVRLSDDRDGSFSPNEFLKYLSAAFLPVERQR